MKKAAALILPGLVALALQAFSQHTMAADGPAPIAQSILDGKQRSAQHRQLDDDQRPQEVLSYFQIKPTQKVIEIWPGDGWYTEILAPYLKDGGSLTTAVEPDNSPERHARRRALLDKIADDADTYGDATLITFAPPKSDIRPVGGVDLVFSNGNVHTWVSEGTVDGAFAAFYRALRSGGTLAVVNVEAQTGVSAALITGYATTAGFVADGQKAIGHSGQLALRFVKPADAKVPSDVVKSVRAD